MPPQHRRQRRIRIMALQIKLRSRWKPNSRRNRKNHGTGPHQTSSCQLFTTFGWGRKHHRRFTLQGHPSLTRTTHCITDISCPSITPPKFSDNNPFTSSYFLDRLASTISAQEAGVNLATYTKYARSWHIWLEFCSRIPTNDPHLDSFMPRERNIIICVFMDTVHNGEFAPRGFDSVKGETARQAADHVAATIIASGGADPRIDSSGNKCIQFRRQINAYKTIDGPVKHQKALVPEVYRWLLCHAAHPRELARAHLLAGALFFAMRSCEYSKTQNSKHQKTKPIRPIDITFRNGPQIIPHDNPAIFNAETVEITFEDQKNGVLKDQVVQQRSNDPELDPPKHWAQTITHLRSYPNYDPTWPVYHFYNFETGKHSEISST